MADEPQEGRIILYQEDGRNVPVEVTYWRETFWLTQQKMAELFNVTVPTINEHLKNIFSSGELTETSTIRKSRIVRQEGSRQVSREISFYNLDAIIAVGYRVNSRQATQFRQWATGILLYLVVFRFGLTECLEIGKRWYFNVFTILQVVTGYDCMERNVTVFVCGLYAE